MVEKAFKNDIQVKPDSVAAFKVPFPALIDL
jgi:hypothetical protein